MPAGRPTLYKPEYCEMLIEHMAQGLSYETFAATFRGSRSTLYLWEKEYPEFMNAKIKGFEACQAFWEKAGNDGLWSTREKGTFNSAVWIYNMKCRFPKQWHDAKVAQDAGVVTSVTVNMGYNPNAAPEPEDE